MVKKLKIIKSFPNTFVRHCGAVFFKLWFPSVRREFAAPGMKYLQPGRLSLVVVFLALWRLIKRDFLNI